MFTWMAAGTDTVCIVTVFHSVQYVPILLILLKVSDISKQHVFMIAYLYICNFNRLIKNNNL